MAPKFSNKGDGGWTGRRIDLPEFSRAVAARKAELGLPELPDNAGENRTTSKRALLTAIKDVGGKW
ncbi:MAG: hypothetical protein ACR2PC_13405 [Tsuneonella suprasediminis]|nr:hypothetical protein LBX01_10230 [Altererythrobacter sp. N1]